MEEDFNEQKEEKRMEMQYGITLKFKDSHIEQNYFEKNYKSLSVRLILICLCTVIISFIELITHYLISPDFYEDATLKNIILTANIVYIAVSIVICLCCIKCSSSRTFTRVAKVLIYASSIVYYLCYFESIIYFDTRYSVKLRYFYFLLIYFSVVSSLMFNFNVLKSIVNLSVLIYINIRVQISAKHETELSITEGDDIFPIIFLSLVFEYYSHYYERQNRELFRAKVFNENRRAYYYGLLSNAKNGLAIFKEGKLEFRNKEIIKNNAYFPDLFTSEFQSKNEILTMLAANFEREDSIEMTSADELSSNPDNEVVRLRGRGDLSFEYIGLFKSIKTKETKYFDIYINEHEMQEEKVYSLMEIMIVDLTFNIKAKKAEADMKFKNYLQSKASHEFISTLVAIKTKTEDIEEKDASQRKSTSKIISLTDYLVFLMEELVIFVEDKMETSTAESNFDFVEIVERNVKIAHTFNSTIGKRIRHNLISLLVKEETAEKLHKFKVLMKGKEKLFSNFVLNVLIFVFKIAKENIKIEVICDEASAKGTCLQVVVHFASDINATMINNMDLGMYEYSEMQGIDISVAICRKISSMLNLNFGVEERENNLVAKFSCSALQVSACRREELEESCSDSSCGQTKLFRKGYYYVEESSVEEKRVRFDSRSEFHRETGIPKNSLGMQDDSASVMFEDREMRSPLLQGNKKARISRLFDGRKIELKSLPEKFMTKSSYEVEDSMICDVKKVILVVDDMVIMRKQLCNIIRKVAAREDYTVEEVEDGADLILRLIYYNESPLEGKVVLVISDEFMNDLNGSEALRIMNIMAKRGKVKEVPFVFNTAFVDEANLERIQSTHPSMILNKPISKDQMATVFDTLSIKR